MSDKDITATELAMTNGWVDRRRRSSIAIAYAVYDEIRDLLTEDQDREVLNRIQDVIYQNGVLLIRDEERGALGLEPADILGWTPSERVKREQDLRYFFARLANSTFIRDQNGNGTATATQTVNPTVNSENALDDESEKT